MFERFFVCPALPWEEALWQKVEAALLEDEKVHGEVMTLPEHVKLRFLRASAHIKKESKQVERIVSYICKHVSFRQKVGVDSIFDQQLPFLEEFRESMWPGRLLQRTTNFEMKNLSLKEKERQEKGLVDFSYKRHRGVILTEVGKSDFSAAKVLKSSQDIERYTVFAEELLNLKYQSTWSCACKTVAIYDLSAVTLSDYRAAYKFGITTVFQVLEANYPEAVDKIFILHPPKMFSLIFGMVKVFMDKETQSNLYVLRSDEAIKAAFEKEGIEMSRFPKDICSFGAEEVPSEKIIDDDILRVMRQDTCEDRKEAVLAVLSKSAERDFLIDS